MATATSQIHIQATAPEVWAVLEDVRLLTELSPSTVAVEAPERLTRVGERFEQTVVLAGRSFTSKWEVTEIEPGRRLVIDGSVVPGTRYRMTEDLDDLGERSGDPCTRLTLRMDYKLPFGPLGRLAAKLGVERRAGAEAAEVLRGVDRIVTRRRSAADPSEVPDVSEIRP